jgi:hypothetical protein
VGHIVILGEEPDLEHVPISVRQDAVTWLASSPNASEALRGEKAEVLIPEDLVAPSEVASACVDAYEKLRSICERFDQLFEDGKDKIFSCALTDLGKRTDSVIWRSMVLERLYKKIPGSKLAAFRPAPKVASQQYALPFPTQAWSVVLENMDCAADVVWLSNSGGGNGAPKRAQKLVPRLVRRSPMVWSILQSWRCGLRQNLRGLADSGRRTLLMLKAPYDWEPAITWAAQNGWRIIFDEPERYFNSATETRRALPSREVDNIWMDFCLDLPAAARKPTLALLPEIRSFALAGSHAVKHVQEIVAKTCDRFGVTAVLNAIAPDMQTQAVLQAYRQHHVPALKWQHGSVWWKERVTQRMDDCDLATADIQIAYGIGSQFAYQAAGHHAHCRVVPIGSSRLAAFYARAHGSGASQPSSPRTILYSPTNLYGDEWYCGFSPPFMDGIYYRDQVELVRGLDTLLASHPALTLTVKLPSHCRMDRIPLLKTESAGGTRRRVVTGERTYSELLLAHDMVLIDCATTTMLEALCTRRPVYVLLRAPQWPEKELNLLRRRAVCADNPEELISSMRRHLETGRYDADLQDEVFVRRHGLMNDPVKGVQEILRELAGQEKAVVA